MLYEWYSGSDEDKRIPALLSRIRDEEGDVPKVESVPQLKELLKQEHDPNWRAFILKMIADRYNREERIEESVRYYRLAHDSFDPLAPNFLDVVGTYCSALYRLIGDSYLDSDSPEDLFVATVSILSYWDELDFDVFERSMVLSWLVNGLQQLGHHFRAEVFYRAALAVALAAHHVDSDDPAILESLLYAYFNCDQVGRAREVYEMFLERSERYEYRDRVIQFVKDRMGDGV